MDRSFDHLSPQERAVVGDPSEYDWDDPITPPPAQPKSSRTQFSMRVDQVLFDRISAVAELRGVSFSDVVRQAITDALDDAVAVVPGQLVSFGTAGRIIGADVRTTIWTEGTPVFREQVIASQGTEEDHRTTLAGYPS